MTSNATRLCCLLMLGLLSTGCAVSARDDSAKLAGKVVVITGASSGFGRGVALELARVGSKVVLAARDEEALRTVAQEAGGDTLVVPTDVGRPEHVAGLMEAATQRFGNVDVWINNAGVGALGRFEDIPIADQLRLININLDGVLVGSYHAMRKFRAQGFGTLINVASVEGRVPLPYQAAYVASKHAVVGLGAALNQELRLSSARGIHVVTVNPFATDTPFFLHAANYTGRSPRSVLLDPPEKVVHAIVSAITRPQPEIAVGYKAKLSQASQHISRTVTQSVVAKIYHGEQMEKAPPAESTSGTLHVRDGDGGGINGGNVARIEREDQNH